MEVAVYCTFCGRLFKTNDPVEKGAVCPDCKKLQEEREE